MRESHNFKKLIIYNKAIEIVLDVYKLCKKLPNDEKFGLISQIKRASISIPSNIAEGAGRSSRNDINRFMDISIGSINELYTQLLICLKLNYIEEKEFNENTEKLAVVSKMITRFKTRKV